MTERRRRPLLAALARSLGILAFALLIYYGLPSQLSSLFERGIVGVLLSAVGIAGLTALVALQTRRIAQSAESERGGLFGVVSVTCIVVVSFALWYYLLEANDPDQFEGLVTRTDALYYSVSTLGTVGSGNIVAVGQLARIATTIQVAFDLVLIGALAAVASSLLAGRIREKH